MNGESDRSYNHILCNAICCNMTDALWSCVKCFQACLGVKTIILHHQQWEALWSRTTWTAVNTLILLKAHGLTATHSSKLICIRCSVSHQDYIVNNLSSLPQNIVHLSPDNKISRFCDRFSVIFVEPNAIWFINYRTKHPHLSSVVSHAGKGNGVWVILCPQRELENGTFWDIA